MEYSPDGKVVLGLVELGDDKIVGSITDERSVVIPAWIISHPDLSDRAVRLWGYLKGAVNGSFTIPGTSHRSLSVLLDVSGRTAREAIYELRDAGAITVVARFKDNRQIGNHYYLWPVNPSEAEGGVAADCHHGSQLPPEYITNNTNIDTKQNFEGPVMKVRATPKKRSRKSYHEDFENIWSIYPRRVNKAGASKAFHATLRKGASLDDLILSVRNYASERIGQEEKFTLHGETFFGPNERWKDYLPSTQADEPDGEELTAATIYDIYDRGEGWVDYQTGEPVTRLDNPAKYGYTRPTNTKGQLVSASGTPYVLDAQGNRRNIDYWN
jgi:hypothetical protein